MAFVGGFGFGGQAVGGGGFQQQPAPQNTAPQPQQNMQQQQQVSQQPLVSGTQGMPQSGYGMQNPYHTDNYPVQQPPAAPNQQQMQDFLPPILGDPYTNSINNAQNQANWFGQATPGAASFLSSIFQPGMTGMEQQYAGSAAQLGARQLGDTHNRIAGMFENSASHGSLAPAMMDATGQFNQQINQMIGQMGTQRQQLAGNLVPFAAGFPLQAGQAGQQAAEGLYNMGQNAMYGDLNFPSAQLGSNVYSAPSIIAT
jgi:hypothetical protein